MVYSHNMVRAICLLCFVAWVPSAADGMMAAQKAKPKTQASAVKTSLDVACPADLGTGVKSKRPLCDVIVATDPAAGIVMRIPPHTGKTTLRFDLHNRFAVAAPLPFARASALVAVLNGNSGALIERAAVLGELRKELDLFDRIAGAGPGATKAVAPGRAQPVTISVPATVTSISIVGVRVEVTTIDGRTESTTMGRPVAIASNFRIEYTPAAVVK